jgi:UDP-arabinose 4-epimerase
VVAVSLDLGEAHARAAAYLRDGGASDVFNLGTGTGTSVLEIADAVETATGARFERVIGPRRDGDPAHLVAAAEKAQQVLGWSPKRSGITEIVADAVQWQARDGAEAAKPALVS